VLLSRATMFAKARALLVACRQRPAACVAAATVAFICLFARLGHIDPGMIATSHRILNVTHNDRAKPADFALVVTSCLSEDLKWLNEVESIPPVYHVGCQSLPKMGLDTSEGCGESHAYLEFVIKH
jgi:hypothetical protein